MRERAHDHGLTSSACDGVIGFSDGFSSSWMGGASSTDMVGRVSSLAGGRWRVVGVEGELEETIERPSARRSLLPRIERPGAGACERHPQDSSHPRRRADAPTAPDTYSPTVERKIR